MDYNLQIDYNDYAESKINPFLYLRSKCLENGKVISTRKLEKLMKGAVHHTHISELEHGARPTMNQLKAYHDFFHVSYDFLMGESECIGDNPDGEKVLLSEFDKAIMNLRMAKEMDGKLIWQTLQMLISTEKGYAVLYYLSQYFYGKEGKTGYQSRNGTLYLCQDHYKDSMEAAKLVQVLEYLKNNKDELSYHELRLYIENTVKG